MSNSQPFEFFAGVAVLLAAFFLFLQVSIYGDAGKGWIDRPLWVRAPMSLVAASLCYKFYAWVWLGEHFTHGGAITSYCLALWQFTSVFYAVTQSYKNKAEAVVAALFDNHPAWGQVEPGYGNPLMFHGNDREALQKIESRARIQKDSASKSS